MREIKVSYKNLQIIGYIPSLNNLSNDSSFVYCPHLKQNCYIHCACFLNTPEGLLYCTFTPCPSLIGRVEGSNAEIPEFNGSWTKSTLL